MRVAREVGIGPAREMDVNVNGVKPEAVARFLFFLGSKLLFHFFATRFLSSGRVFFVFVALGGTLFVDHEPVSWWMRECEND